MEQVNHNIRCSVSTCAFHAGNENYCTLREIKVGRCVEPTTSPDCTECASFELNKHQK